MKAKFVYESIDDILKPKSEEEIMSSLENSDLIPNDLLIKSSKSGFLPGVKKALEMGAYVHAANDYSLQCASYYGHYNMVELLLKNDADVHAQRDYSLRWASYDGHYKIVELLLKNGADVHAENDFALQYALKYGHKNVVELLKKYMNKEIL